MSDVTVNELTKIIAECLVAKQREAFDSTAALARAVAIEVAERVEADSIEYTDTQIADLKRKLAETDFGELQTFMSELNELLGGGLTHTDSFLTFTQLVGDTVSANEALKANGEAIESITGTLAGMSEQQDSNGERIDALMFDSTNL